MPLIRPEITALLKRWSEVLWGVAIVAIGLWALQSHDLFFRAIAALICVAGLGLALIGWRRLRFRREVNAAGVVQVVEGQISYFGPETGGFIGSQDLAELHLIDTGRSWLLIANDGTRLEIPVAAKGADALFDAFATLPDLKMQSLIDKMDNLTPRKTETMWLHPSRQARWRQIT